MSATTIQPLRTFFADYFRSLVARFPSPVPPVLSIHTANQTYAHPVFCDHDADDDDDDDDDNHFFVHQLEEMLDNLPCPAADVLAIDLIGDAHGGIAGEMLDLVIAQRFRPGARDEALVAVYWIGPNGCKAQVVPPDVSVVGSTDAASVCVRAKMGWGRGK